MTVSKEQFDALSGEVKTLSESVKTIGNSIGTSVAEAVALALKPVTDQLTANAADQKAKDEAELATLREKIVKANLMDADAAGELTINTARALAPKADPGQAAPLANGFTPRTGERKGHTPPKAVK